MFNVFRNQNIASDSIGKAIRSMAVRSDRPIDELAEYEFKERYVPINLKDDFLPAQLGKVFLDYQYREFVELVYKKAEAEHFGEEPPIRSIEEFREKYGPQPWKIIESILQKFSSLKFTINNPENLRFRTDAVTEFALQIRNEKDTIIPFNDLSSGEKVLFALVLSIYKSSGDGFFPRALLLDEIDASLHPSMTRNLLNVLQETFVEENGVKVVLATHSPSTVALSPLDSIYVVNRGEVPEKIVCTSREKALEILTEGFISLEHGLKIVDQIARNKVNVFTEGNNVDYIRRAIELLAPEILNLIDVVDQIRDRSGSQLYPLYELIYRLDHDNRVLFVFDCEDPKKLSSDDKTDYFYMSLNEENAKFKRGIENAFPEHLFLDEHFDEKLVQKDNGETILRRAPNKARICAHIFKERN